MHSARPGQARVTAPHLADNGVEIYDQKLQAFARIAPSGFGGRQVVHLYGHHPSCTIQPFHERFVFDGVKLLGRPNVAICCPGRTTAGRSFGSPPGMNLVRRRDGLTPIATVHDDDSAGNQRACRCTDGVHEPVIGVAGAAQREDQCLGEFDDR
jgi:hypothetical protein